MPTACSSIFFHFYKYQTYKFVSTLNKNEEKFQPLSDSKVDSVFNPSKIDQISTIKSSGPGG